MKLILIILVTLTLTTNSCSQDKTKNKPEKASQITSDNPYPFQIVNSNGQFTIVAQIEQEDLLNKYGALFERNGYEGNGYCWEGHITQILEKTDRELLSHIQFDPEAGAFYAYADSKDAQIKFINILSPIFSDLKKLEDYVKAADRRRIDD